jgi:hypothetical protein
MSTGDELGNELRVFASGKSVPWSQLAKSPEAGSQDRM